MRRREITARVAAALRTGRARRSSSRSRSVWYNAAVDPAYRLPRLRRSAHARHPDRQYAHAVAGAARRAGRRDMPARDARRGRPLTSTTRAVALQPLAQRCDAALALRAPAAPRRPCNASRTSPASRISRRAASTSIQSTGRGSRCAPRLRWKPKGRPLRRPIRPTRVRTARTPVCRASRKPRRHCARVGSTSLGLGATWPLWLAVRDACPGRPRVSLQRRPDRLPLQPRPPGPVGAALRAARSRPQDG